MVVSDPLAVRAQQHAERAPYTSSSDYGGSPDSMQYSALKQIDKANVARLEQAWFFPVPDRKGNFGFNPIVVDGVIYVLGPSNAIVALDAASGRQIWSHGTDGMGPGNRGLNYWESADRSDRRLFFGAGGFLHAIDARTGETIRTFGSDGRVNMREGPLRPRGGRAAPPAACSRTCSFPARRPVRTTDPRPATSGRSMS